MSAELKTKLKGIVEQTDALYSKINRGEASNEEKETYKSLSAEAQDIATTLDTAKKLQDVKNWSKESDGTAQVPATFDRLALTEEGELKGITADPKTGELRVLEGMYSMEGEANLKTLSSGAYKDFFAQRIRLQGNHKTAGNWMRHIKGHAMKILNEGSFTEGEAWLPPDFRPQLVQRMATLTSVRPNATVMSTGTDHVTFPQAKYTADDKYTSPFRGTWMGSGAQNSSPSEGTNPIAGQIRIPVFLLTANIILQREQIEDNSFDIMGYITKIGAESFALTQEDAYTNGDGVSKPVGFTLHPSASIANGSTATVAGVTYSGARILSGSSGALAWGTATGGTGIRAVETALPPQYEPGAAWYASKATYGAIRDINAGTATLPQWSLGESYPNYANGMQARLLGYPIKKNQFMPTIAESTANQTPVATLGDLSSYWIVDRVGFSVEVNPWIYQDRDQVLVYMRMRTGGQLVEYWKNKFLVVSA